VLQGGVSSNSTVASVGFLGMPIYWRSFIRNILAERSDGIVVVFESPCNQPFTYQIYGPRVVYLGVGDLHDPKYNYLGVTSSVVEFKNYSARDTDYSGVPISADFCPHTIRVYPSDIMKLDYTSRNAVNFFVSVILIFSFTSFVFFIYDWYVERRQLRVKSAAMYSSDIVSSLFPSTVRDQIFPKNKCTDEVQRKMSKYGADLPMTPNGSDDNTTPIIGTPIAQVYQDTTVIFADIVGFTAWSASRDPTQVFHLLETVYAAFDALARLYGVFKIETIGDCYVAVVGLPKSRKRHAIAMVKFADAMRAKMMTVVNSLEETLGPVSPWPLLQIFLDAELIYNLPTLSLISTHEGDIKSSCSNWFELGSNDSGCATRRESQVSIIR
jgi:Adenylate and Guanylate cyclase catalytic domain